jgi:biotin operon repressor
MGDKLSELNAEYDQSNQAIKRNLGSHLYHRPAQWVSQQDLATEFEKDPSTVSRHLDDFHDDGYVISKTTESGRYVQWAGRGGGGVRYWVRELVPTQLWLAGSELRPLLRFDRFGGAYLPTLLFGLLMVVGLVMGVATYLIAEFELGGILGYSTTDILVLTGIVTVLASVFLCTAILWRLLVLGVSAMGLLPAWAQFDSAEDSD